MQVVNMDIFLPSRCPGIFVRFGQGKRGLLVDRDIALAVNFYKARDIVSPFLDLWMEKCFKVVW